MRKMINVIFIGVIMVFLFVGLVKTVFFPVDINELENRYANKIEEFQISDFMEGKYQSQVSSALNDQVVFETFMKKIYNYLTSFYETKLLFNVLQSYPDDYISYKGGLVYNGSLVYYTRNFATEKPYFDEKLENIYAQVKAHPEVDFYVYYIEKDTDIYFETKEKIGAYEYLEANCLENNIPVKGFIVNDYETFGKYFYKSDHHWNCYGSYKAYGEVLELLEVKEPLVPINGEYLLNYNFSGSKAAAVGAMNVFVEKFPAYKYDYMDMDIRIDGQPADDYGSQEQYINYEKGRLSYGEYYGWDNAEIIFDTGNTEKENILVIGESYDNAILKLLATHFNKTHSIDLRYYEVTFGEKFAFSTYVEENGIDKVLLIGNIDYYVMDEFMLED